MRENKLKNKTTYRTLLRGVSWFSSLIAIVILLTACGGGGEDNQPPPPSAASIMGLVTFTDAVPLTTPPGDAFDGPVPPDVRYGARIIDPGDDIGGVPVPKPSVLSSSGNYEFGNLETDPMSWFNLRFTVDAPLDSNGFLVTPVGFNIPIALLDGVVSLLSVNIDKPSDSVLEMTYIYRGPDGSRKISLRVDFITDLITFDLDSDGLYDDMIGVDRNHDAIPESHVPVIENLDYNETTGISGTITAISSDMVSVTGVIYEIWGSTNIMNGVSKDPLVMSDMAVGDTVSVNFVEYAKGNLATCIDVQPDPVGPGTFLVKRDGVIEELDASDIVVGGILFHDYPSANIEDVLGNKMTASDLDIGEYVRVTGERVDNYITTTEIIAETVTPPPTFVERLGVISALHPDGNPTSMTVSGMEFVINPSTLIRDLAGTPVGADYLKIDHPVWVFGHEAMGLIIADLVELQFTIEDKVVVPEIVILINDWDVLAEYETAIADFGSDLTITPIVIAAAPDLPENPPCIEDAYDGLYGSDGAYNGLKDMPGFVVDGAKPRVDGDECVILIMVFEAYEDFLPWYTYFWPNGINGVPFEYDLLVNELKAQYGSGPEILQAIDQAQQLRELFDEQPNLVEIYVSSEIGTWDGD